MTALSEALHPILEAAIPAASRQMKQSKTTGAWLTAIPHVLNGTLARAMSRCLRGTWDARVEIQPAAGLDFSLWYKGVLLLLPLCLHVTCFSPSYVTA